MFLYKFYIYIKQKQKTLRNATKICSFLYPEADNYLQFVYLIETANFRTRIGNSPEGFLSEVVVIRISDFLHELSQERQPDTIHLVKKENESHRGKLYFKRKKNKEIEKISNAYGGPTRKSWRFDHHLDSNVVVY